MKSYPIKALALLLLLSSTSTSCSYREYSAITSGSSLGAIFGSSIGGLIGGPRGSDKGTLAGMVIGAAAGAAVVNQSKQKAERQARSADADADYDNAYAAQRGNGADVQYGTYNTPSPANRMAAHSDLCFLEVTHVHFLDSNNNQCLDPDESAFIEFDLYNRADHTLYNVTPLITCTNKRVLVSPAATVASIASGRGIRYKAAIRAPHRLRAGNLGFTVSFGAGKSRITARQFTIQTAD